MTCAPTPFDYESILKAAAAYAHGLSADMTPDQLKEALQKAGLRTSEAAELVSKYDLLYAKEGVFGAGIAVFRDKETGRKTIAIDGTDLGSLWEASLDSFTDFQTFIDSGSFGYFFPQFIELDYIYNSMKENGIIFTGDEVDVTGHSEGGFMAVLLQKQHPNDFQLVTTVNAPKLGGISADILSMLPDELIGKYLDLLRSNTDNVRAIVSDHDPVSHLGDGIGEQIVIETPPGALGDHPIRVIIDYTKEAIKTATENGAPSCPHPGGPGGAGGGGAGGGGAGGGGAGGGGAGGGGWLGRFNPLNPDFWGDPLVLDLNGDGIELVAQSASNSYFDLDRDGFAEKAGWVSGDDGMLALDANGDGIVNDISELVGAGFVSSTPSTDRLNDGPTGFAELAALDGNGDGVIDSADSVWAQLQVWRDIDGDGVTDAGELMGLDAAGVASISTQATDLLPNPQDVVDSGGAGGNVITQQGTFTRTDSTTGAVGDAWLSYDPADTRAEAPARFDLGVISLPFLMGRGELKNSFFAMSEDPLLKEMGRDLASLAMADAGQLSTKVEAFILRWAGADGIDPQSRGQYTNGAYLAAMEKFMGHEFRQLGVQANPYPWAGSIMMANFKQFQSAVMRQILPQIPLGRELMPELSPGYVTAASLEAGTALAPMLERMAAHAPADAGAQVGYWNTMALLVHSLKDQLPETDVQIAAAFTATLADQGLGLSYDQIRGALIGGAGDDVIVGTTDFTGTDAFSLSRDNVLFGGAGDDLLAGSAGADTYLFGYGSGHDTIREPVGGIRHGDKKFDNVIQFLPGVTVDDVAYETGQGPNGADMVIRLISTGETLTIKNQFNDRMPLFTEFVFSDGSHKKIADIAQDLLPNAEYNGVSYALPGFDSVLNGGARGDALVGDSGNDSLNGFGGNDVIKGGGGGDTLDGGAGNDVLQGGKGDDTYIFGAGSGRDVITDGGTISTDTVRFKEGVAFDQLSFSRGWDANDLVIRIAGKNDKLTVDEQFNSLAWDRIENFELWNGASLSWQDITTRMVAEGKTAGNDRIVGFYTDDELDGGAGDDFLQGGKGSDTYLFGSGYGRDMISDGGITGTDTVYFGAGVTADQLVLSRDWDAKDLVIRVAGTNDKLTVNQQFDSLAWERIETFSFADGTAWTWQDVEAMIATVPGANVITGTAAAEILTGTVGRDQIIAGGGNDTLVSSGGDDSLEGEGGDDIYLMEAGFGDARIAEWNGADTVRFGAGVSAAGVKLSRVNNGADLQIDTAEGDRLTIVEQFSKTARKVERIEFADGTVWTDADVSLRVLNESMMAGHDYVRGYGTNDTITGGAGDDRLEGEGGNDTYVFEAGFGDDVIAEWNGTDTVRFGAGISAAGITLAKDINGKDLVIETAAGDRLTIMEQFFKTARVVESFTFADGTVWTAADVAAMVASQPVPTPVSSFWGAQVNGAAGGDTLSGDTGNNLINGGAGNDVMAGGLGDDTYVFDRGYAEDAVQDTGGDDRVYFGGQIDLAALDFTRTGVNGEDLLISVGGVERLTLEVKGQFGDAASRIDTFTFEDGTQINWKDIQDQILMRQTSWGADDITGFATNDVLDGDRGNDILTGGKGDDTIIGGRGRDAAVFSGSAADYEIQVNGDVTVVRDLRADGDGTDTLYGVEDLVFQGQGAPETVNLTPVNQAPTAGNDAAEVQKDGALEIPLAALLANDSDPEGGALSLSRIVNVANGRAWVNLDGNVGFEPSTGFSGEALITYEITDPDGATATATIAVNVVGGNSDPVAVNDTISMQEDAALLISPANLLANDTDSDGDALSITSLDTSATLGSVANNGDGTFSYTPGAAFQHLAVGETATDSFTYTVDDGNGGTASATVAVTVTGTNDGPVAVADTGATDEDTLVTLDVLANDTDVDLSDTHTVDAVTVTSGLGSASIVNNQVVYDPSAYQHLAAGETAQVELTYTMSDQHGAASTAVVTVTVTGTNDGPVAAADLALAYEDSSLTIHAANLLANDRDIDGDTLSISALDTAATLGQVVNNGDGTFGYTPGAAFQHLGLGEVATDSFTYTVSDGHGGEATATVYVTVKGANDRPVAVADNIVTTEDAAVTFNAAALLANDSDVDAHDALSILSIDTTATRGTVVNNGDGTFSYDPAAAFQYLAEGESATDTFTYTVSDDHGGTARTTVTMLVTGSNDGPVAVADSLTASEDAALTFSAADLLANDSDVDASDVLTITAIDSTATLGSVVDNGDGTYAYNPGAAFQHLAEGETATDSFSYTVSDGHGGVAVATVTMTITGANDAPVAVADNLGSVDAYSFVSISAAQLLANDFDVDSTDALSIVAVGNAVNGQVVMSDAGQILFQPDLGYAGAATFEYTVSDGHGGLSTATATLQSILPANLVVGTDRNDKLKGDKKANVIDGRAGDDKISAKDAGDILVGGAGNDELEGGKGDDVFLVSGQNSGIDEFEGGKGFDRIIGSIGDDVIGMREFEHENSVEEIDGGLGLNVIQGTAKDDELDFSHTILNNIGRIEGGAGDDEITGSAAADTIFGGAGADEIEGGAGNDVISGGAGDDELEGGAGDDTFLVSGANDGFDEYEGGAGFDRILGSAGDDVIGLREFEDDNSVELIDGGDGYNVIQGSSKNDELDFSHTVLSHIDLIDGGSGNDEITGSAGRDVIFGGQGNDRIDGGAGTDTAVYSGAFADYKITQLKDGSYKIQDLRKPGHDGTDFVKNIERLQFADQTVYLVPNQNPVANGDSAATVEDTSVIISAAALLANDADGDEDSLSLVSVGGAVGGAVALDGQGNVTFTPDANFSGNATFEYTVSDGHGGLSTATVSVFVAAAADVPVLATAPAMGGEDAAIPLDIAASLTDADGSESMSISIAGVPAGASLSAGTDNGDGTWTLSPADLAGLSITPSVNFSGNFDLTVAATSTEGSNGSRARTIQTLSVSVNSVADVPVLATTPALGDEDTVIPLNITTHLTDADGSESLAITITGVPAGASLSAGTDNGNGSWTLSPADLVGLTITPPMDFSGNFDLTVTATSTEGSNGNAAQTAQTLSVSVNAVADTPALVAASASGDEDTAIALDIAAQLTDADGSESLSITIAGVPSGASLSAGTDNGNGTWTLSSADLLGLTITPPANYSGNFDLTVMAASTEGGNASTAQTAQTLSVSVAAVADAPTLATAPALGDEDTVIPLDIAAQLTDVDGSESLSITITGVPAGAVLSAGTDNGNGSWTLSPADITGLAITPPANFSGNFDLVVTATSTEGNNGDAAQTVRHLNVSVNAVADAPVLSTASASGNEDTAIPLDIAAQLTDVDGSESLSITLTGVPAGASLSAGTLNADGSWSLLPGDLSGLTLTPAANFSGSFDVTVTATAMDGANGDVASTTATLNVSVNAVADAPVLATTPAMGSEDTAIALEIASSLTDVDGSESLSITIAGVPAGASLSAGMDNGNGTWTLSPAELLGLTVTPPVNFSGNFDLTVTATSTEGSNGNAAQTVRTLSVSVSAVADTPVLTTSSAVGDEDTAIPLAIMSQPTDADGSEVLSITISGVPAGAILSAGTDNGNGTWTLSPANLTGLTITPPQDFNGAFDLIVTATSTEQATGGAASVTNTFTVTVAPVNDAPVAVADNALAVSGASILILGANLLANDFDVEGDALSIVSVGNGVGGAVALDTDGNVLFTPNVGFSGNATFDYTIADGNGGTASATVTVEVLTGGNDAPIARDDLLLGGYWADVLTGSDSADTIVSSGGGNDTVNGGGGNDTIIADAGDTINGGDGVDTAVFTESTGTSGGSGGGSPASGATLDLGVSSIENVIGSSGNDTFTAASVPSGTNVSIQGGGGNDAIMGGGGNDTLNGGAGNDTISGGGGSNALSGGEGDDTFTGGASGSSNTISGGTGYDAVIYGGGATGYTFSSGQGGSITIGTPGGGTDVVSGVEQINFGDITVGFDQNMHATWVRFLEDTQVVIPSGLLLANDSDPNGDPIAIVSVQDAPDGSVSLGADGNVVFMPNPNFNGMTTFTYTITDTGGLTDTATVTLYIHPVNDNPVAQADTAATLEDTAVVIPAAALLANDGDVDGDAVSLSGVGNAIGGTATLNASGNVVFTPVPNFFGAATFDYIVSDGKGGISTTTATVHVASVNDAPVALADIAAPNFGSPQTILATALLANDADSDGDVLTLQSVQSGMGGTAGLDANGNVVFTPAANFVGTATFDYTVNDGNGGMSTATVSVAVDAVNDAPVVSGPLHEGDQYAASVVFLSNFDDGTVRDETGRHTVALELGGVTALDHFGGHALDGQAQVSTRSNDFVFDGDFSIEMWLKPNVLNGDGIILDTTLNAGTGGGGWWVYQRGSIIELWHTGQKIIGDLSASNVGVWNHFALTRENGTMRMFMNGQTIATSYYNAVLNADNPLAIGAHNSGSYDFNGGIDGVRLTKGVARYTSNFTVPSTPPSITGDGALFTAYQDTSFIVTEAALLANSTDPNGDVLSVTNLSFGTGTVVDNGDGTYMVTPSTYMSGFVRLAYDVTDGQLSTSTFADVRLLPLTTSDVVILGTTSNDVLTGSAGNDTLIGDPNVSVSANSALFGTGDRLEMAMGAGGSANKFTFSGWVKGASPSSPINGGLWMDFAGWGSRYDYIGFYGNQLNVNLNSFGGMTIISSEATAAMTVNDWNHVFVKVDTTAALPKDRIQIFVNGINIAHGQAPAQNAIFKYANQAGVQRHISFLPSVVGPFQGEVAEVHILDGQDTTINDFGSFVNGVWTPKAYTGNHGATGIYLDFADPNNPGLDASGNGFFMAEVGTVDPGSGFADITPAATGGNDTLAGGAGNDTHIGGAGNDLIDGGAGTDTAVFSGNAADYAVTMNADGSLTVQDTRAGGDGVDTLSNVEVLQFADQNLTVSSLFQTTTPILGGMTVGTEFRVNSYTVGTQQCSLVRALPDGGYWIVWTSYGANSTEWGTYGQRYDAAHNPIGGEVRLNSISATQCVSVLQSGGIVLITHKQFQDGSGFGVFGQLYDVTGSPVGAEFQVNTYVASNQFDPFVTALADGGFVVTWQSFGQDGSAFGIYGQRHDANGNPVGAEFQVNTYTANNQTLTTVTALQDGGFIVVWQSNGQDGAGNGIYGQRYDSTGAPIGSEFQASSSAPFSQEIPAVASLSDGGFVVTWQSLSQDGDLNGIFGQLFDANGAAVGTEFQVNTYTLGEQTSPSVTSLNDGGFMVTWTSDGQDGNSLGIYAQRFDKSAKTVGAELRVNDFTASQQEFSDITVLTNGTVMVTWSSFGQDGSGSGIYAKSYSLTETGLNIEGSIHADTLVGGAGDDILTGLAGNDTLTGGLGNDTYVLGRGDGQDTILNTGEGTSADKVSYATGINHDQLWFTQAGSDLVVGIIGSTDQVAVKDWYVGTANQVAEIETSDGFYLTSSLVNNLVSAMAAMTPPPAGQTDLTVTEHSQLDPVLAANWQPRV